MIGRGNRSRGIATGKVFVVDAENAGQSIPVSQYLDTKESVQEDEGPEVLRAILKGIDTNQVSLNAIKKAFPVN